MVPKPKDMGDLSEEKLLQCVVLADFRQDYGSTISQDIPKVLTPLVNAPLLDYSLDWLERSGIDEVIVYCRAQPHSDMIRQHCKGFTTRRAERGMNVVVVASEDCHSMGDAMRDLYEKSLLKDDFILIYGDTVANIDLQALMTKHRERRSADKKFIMTLLYMNKTGEYIGDDESTATLIANAATGKVLHHVRRSSSKSKLPIPAELLKNCSQLRVFPAVSDPGIAVCSEVVPSLFLDNFDYGTRDSLIRGVIEQEELLDYAIACEVLDSGYATRATSLPLYEKVSNEVIRRQAHPLVPEVSLTSHRIRYLYDDFTNNYCEASAKFHKGSGGRDVVIGAGSEVSLTAQLDRTVIGDHCTIQDNVKISSSFIMNNVNIKKGCVLDQCYLGDNVKLEENVVLLPGCVLGANVILGPNITVPAATCLSSMPPVDEFEEENTTQEPDPKICGSQGHAFVVTEEDEDEDLRKIIWGKEKVEETSSEEELSDEEDMDEVMGEDAHMRDEDEQREYEFRREIRESVTNALSSGSAAENVVLEINASRHAYNMSMEEVLTTVTQVILRAGEDMDPEKYDTEGLWALTKKSLSKFPDVFKNYVRKPRDQITVLNAIEALMSEHKEYLPLAQKIFYELNQVHDVLDNEVIIYWYKKEGNSTPVSTTMKNLIQKFINWLEDDDDEDEESEDDA
ncbi:translation initiation factor eIF2B subunit epsilon [Palaemon carinicauda]|uniref:translation initiation factor eIF2B subunit epsilon n=1 Tax=Palaemon carinicauda TaxID=392227 RepID=UPI0035B605FF